jgi:glycosyltransferase involved in cell wall biosynthesis
MVKISIILPIYNEAENLEPLLKEITFELKKIQQTFEIIAVDDGSIDGSAKVLDKLCDQISELKVVQLRRNFGQAAAFDAGFKFSKGEILITMDADRQNDPADISKLVKKIQEEDFDFVTGWRENRKDSLFLRSIPSRMANWLIRAITRTKFIDLGCSLKAYRREVTLDLRLYGEMHRFLSILIEGTGARCAQVAVNHRPRVAGVSKYGISRTFKVLLDLITIWFMRGYQTKPIYVFGGVGFGLIFVSALISAFVLYQKFFLEVWVHRNPLFVLSMISSIIGFQFLGMGLLAEIVIRTYFESQDKRAYHVARTRGF